MLRQVNSSGHPELGRIDCWIAWRGRSPRPSRRFRTAAGTFRTGCHSPDVTGGHAPMTHEATVDGGTGREEQVSLPRRADARRCSYTERGERRCVLPPDHEL